MRNFRNNRQPSVGTKMRRKIINSLQLPPDIGRDRAAYMAGGPPNCFICSKAPMGEAAAKPSYTKLTEDESAKFCSHLGIPVNFFARKLSLFEICPPCYEKIKRMKTILTSPEARANFQAYKEELKSLRSFFEGEFNRFYVPLDLEELKTSIRCVIGLCFFGPFLRRLIAEEMKSPKSPAELQFLEKISTHKLLTPKPIEPTPQPAAIVRPRCFICCQQGVGFSRNSGLVRLSPLESHSLTQLLEFTEPTAESLLNAQVCSSCHERIKLVPGLYHQLELVTMELAGAHQYVHGELFKPEPCPRSTACPDFLRIRKQAQNGESCEFDCKFVACCEHLERENELLYRGPIIDLFDLMITELMASQSMLNDSGDVDPPDSPEQPMDSLETCWDECYEWDEAAPDLLEDGSEVEPLSSSPVTPSGPPLFSSSIVETDPSSLPADYPSLIHQCNVCSKKFAFADLLMLHEKFQHRRNEYGFLVWERQAKPEYTCEYCDSVFKTLQLLWKHRKIHTGDWPFICGVCGKGFTDKTKWRQHVLLHQGIKEVECPICHKLFSSRRIMRVHQAKHAGVRTHHCTSCDKSYVSAAALQKHVEAIHGNEKYFCDICGKQLPSKHYLYVHARTHKEKEGGFVTPTNSTEFNQRVPLRVLNAT